MPHYHGRDLRKGRFSEPGRVYLVTTVTRDRLPIFGDWRMGRILAHEMRDAVETGLAESLAWVVMPDHLHWLLELRREDLAALMRRVKSRSARRLNAHLFARGPVWQRGFHDRALRREEDLRGVARYVIANPVRASLVRTVGDYPLWDAAWL